MTQDKDQPQNLLTSTHNSDDNKSRTADGEQIGEHRQRAPTASALRKCTRVLPVISRLAAGQCQNRPLFRVRRCCHHLALCVFSILCDTLWRSKSCQRWRRTKCKFESCLKDVAVASFPSPRQIAVQEGERAWLPSDSASFART
jgi:hypothetical protein